MVNVPFDELNVVPTVLSSVSEDVLMIVDVSEMPIDETVVVMNRAEN